MTESPNIKSFLERVDEDEDITGDSVDRVLDGDVEFRISIGRIDEDEPRSGSLSILFKTDQTLEELAQQEIFRASQVDERVEDIEGEVIDLINTYLGYNAYEPILDDASMKNEDDYDVVMHDSVMVYE